MNVDGDEVVFDVTVVRDRLPTIGEPVRVVLGPGRLRPRVVELWTLEPAVEPIPPLPPARALAILQEHGLARDLDRRRLRVLVRDLGGDDDVDLASVLTAYYSDEPAAAARDGFATYDWRFGNDTDDVFADLQARVGGPTPLLVQVENDPDEAILRARSRSGEERVFDFNEDVSLHDVVRWFDEELARAGDERRFFSMDGGDAYVFFLLPPRVALDLHRRRALAFQAHPALPLAAHPRFEAAAVAYRAGAYKTATAGFTEVLGVLGREIPASDRRWLEVIVKLSSSLGHLMLDGDTSVAKKLLDEADASARALPDGGLGLDTVRLREGIAKATKKLPSFLPPPEPVPAPFAPPIVFQAPAITAS